MEIHDIERQKKAERRFGHVLGFYIHGAVFFGVMTVLILVNVLTKTEWWVQWPLIGWGIGVIAHGLLVFGPFSRAFVAWRARKIEEIKTTL